MPVEEFVAALGENEQLLENEELQTPDGMIHFRYGICDVNDLIRDLRYWETLFVSSLMQRPIN